ncbi:MAG: Rrf2 family transcriptional regulator [Candidatus Omnitrophica bacterium CG23_combo_of_CG06-09_8_20_14_all_40_11]|nr:MAG: Rrf2 family transcriptional regulator [Candidatus Omnitrophica bacterium CG23_combo_of_CG06-09_8_20_14_all_40_11]
MILIWYHYFMKLITRNTDYAVRALCFIANSKARIVPVGTLVKELKIPRPFLRKILQTLHNKGILKASKGYGGGFSLALPVNKIFLVDLIKIFQGPLKLNECIFKKKLCPNRNTCPLKRKIDGIEKYVASKLESITIASLLKRS